MTQPIPPAPVPQVTLLLLKAAHAPKRSKRAEGQHVDYRLWTNEARSDVFVQIAGNAGGGQHSFELVPFAKIAAVVEGLPADTPLKAKAFKTAFRGRSSNNFGFLLCILYAEDLLQPFPDKAFCHAPHGDWSAWKHACLQLPGEPTEIARPLAEAALEALPADTPEPTPKGRRGKRKAQAEEATNHADAA